ncbi:Hypothetical protein, putative [Bodo saltans]|uniref:Uncharacterized protein n=1 Tax=Bodo saltans TaxID=75058 RepID=A0A0S4JQ18_BODSA|nr:Hypothetical protein, putative [Bodo saltans]|eukprot:CUG91477.1 Hypothetical protein, putative [Bodo saltans]
MGSGTVSGEMSVPNNSMIGSGFLPPNNSICYTSAQAAVAANNALRLSSEDGPLGFGGNTVANSISDEKLSDQLIQVALYQQIEFPPSANGDSSAAREAFADIDFANTKQIPFRHIQRLLRDEDQNTIGQIYDSQAVLDVEQFIAFVELAAAAQLKRNGSSTAVAESE